MGKGKENEDLMELGKRSRAGRMISEYLRGIGNEKTETIIDPVTCKSVIVSKAEYLTRKLWDKALGRRVRENPETGQVEITDGDIDLDCAKWLVDRVEGKVGVNGESADTGKPTAAEKVSEINKRRMNAMAEGGDE
jgi:hypothetical protein